MTLPQLPVHERSFVQIRQLNKLYVDKTDMIAQIVNSPFTYILITRPRRFGKSTMISVLNELYSNGLNELFDGLKIKEDQLCKDLKTYDVLHLDFSSGDNKTAEEFDRILIKQMKDFVNKCQIDINLSNAQDCTDYYPLNKQRAKYIAQDLFIDICEYYKNHNDNLVLLIDEYDAPIIHSVLLQDSQLIIRNSSLLATLLNTVKQYSGDSFAKVVVTGIAQYSNMSLFSSVNIFEDLSYSPSMQTLFGFTQEELEHYFAGYIEESAAYFKLSKDQLLQILKDDFDGYYFSQKAANEGKQGIYNPISILSFFVKYRDLEDFPQKCPLFWEQSGAPKSSFMQYYCAQLVSQNLLSDSNKPSKDIYDQNTVDSVYQLFANDQISITKHQLNAITDVTDIDPTIILLQSGYYCFAPKSKDLEEPDDSDFFEEQEKINLTFPNKEVRKSFKKDIRASLITYLGADKSSTQSFAKAVPPLLSFKNDNAERLAYGLNILVSALGYDAKFAFASSEAVMSSVLRLMLRVVLYQRCKIFDREIYEHNGRIDLVVGDDEDAMLLEFKLANKGEKPETKMAEALKQISDIDYGRYYALQGIKVHRFGVVYSAESGNITVKAASTLLPASTQ